MLTKIIVGIELATGMSANFRRSGAIVTAYATRLFYAAPSFITPSPGCLDARPTRSHDCRTFRQWRSVNEHDASWCRSWWCFGEASAGSVRGILHTAPAG